MTFTDRLRVFFKTFLEKTGQALLQRGISANMITLTGVAGNIIAAYCIARGYLVTGGIVILCMGPLDALDGAVARAKGEIKPFGAFLDSVTDRYSELVVFLGLLIHFLRMGNSTGVIVTFIAAAGSILVSYTRARAEGVGYQVKAGLMTRVERYLVLVPGIIFGFPLISIWIIAILANFTAIQRIWIVWNYSKEEEKEK